MSSEVGSGHVTVFPVMKGFRRKVAQEVQGAGDAGARGFKRAFQGTGRRLGTSLGQETSKGFSAAMKVA